MLMLPRPHDQLINHSAALFETAPPCYPARVIEHGAALFETAIGRCGIVWTERGIAALRLPSATDEETESELRRLAHEAEADEPKRRHRA